MFDWERPYLARDRRSVWGRNNYFCCGPACLKNFQEIFTLEGNTTIGGRVGGLGNMYEDCTAPFRYYGVVVVSQYHN